VILKEHTERVSKFFKLCLIMIENIKFAKVEDKLLQVIKKTQYSNLIIPIKRNKVIIVIANKVNK
jgi:hypothetical protein